MKVLATGSREWTSEQIIRRELSLFPGGTIIVHGACPWGADAIVDRISRELGFEVREYKARWGSFSRGFAGHARNDRMIREEHRPEEPIDLCLAFPTVLCRGTVDCLWRAEQKGIPTKVVTE